MLAFSKRLIYALSNKVWQRNTEEADEYGIEPEGKFTIDFARVKKSPFDIKSESSYNAYLSKGSLEVGLKRLNCIAWADITDPAQPQREYQDHIIEAKFQLDSMGGYAASGIIFRIFDDDSYYMALISSKGYFRLDVVKNSAPKTLIAWTEISDFKKDNRNPAAVNLKIITHGTFLIFIVNGKWIGEVNDNTVICGKIGFAVASYMEENAQIPETAENETENEPENTYVCKANLGFISIDTRIKRIEEIFKYWTDESNINAEVRLRLAETFAVMGEPVKSLDQINRAWKRRDEVISAVSDSSGVRTKKELLLVARMTFRLGQYNDAEELINSILDQWPDSPEGKLAYTEKIKILNELNRFEDLKQFVRKYPFKQNLPQMESDSALDYYTIIARCHWELKEYAESAEAWNKAFELKKDNGVYAANAANAHELAGNKKDALTRYIDAGKIFMNQDNKQELEALMPKLSSLGCKNWEARALAGKWAFSIEDYKHCALEFEAANKIRCSIKPRPKADPAIYYLWGLVLIIYGKNKSALRFLEKAVKLAPDYGLFRFKLAETKLKNGIKDNQLAEELKTALNQIDDPDGNMAEYAGNLLLNAGDVKSAKYFFNLTNKGC
ncbi:MAG: hypothetical protein FWD14_07485 [Treponema sp.]|nr:hypothetical protein [Treponema sp.]